jgi:hypothetical protein
MLSENNILKKFTILEEKVFNYKTDFFNEVLERDHRKCNIILFNASEPISDNVSDDLKLVSSVFPTLNLAMKSCPYLKI